MLVDEKIREWTGRFSRKALFLSASALSLVPIASTAEAGPVENVPFFSMYGGYLFNESDPNAEFDPTAFGLNGLGELNPGRDGVMAGAEFGRPISPDWDVRASLTGAVFENDRSQDAGDGATATDRLNFQYLDAELGYRPGVLRDRIRLFAGPRLLHATNDIDYGYDLTNGFGRKTGSYENDVDLFGAGLRAGAQADVPLGSRFSLSLLGAGSAVAARSEHDYSFATTGFFNNSAGADNDVEWHGTYDVQGVGTLNFALNDRVQLQAGYQVQQWWDLTAELGQVDGNEVTAGNNKGDLLTHGPVGRITVKLP